jgi:hypothetical protein
MVADTVSSNVDYAMDHSETLAAARVDTMLWKVTGRYHVLNIGRIVRSVLANSDLLLRYA